jgi:hypothetical protein
LVFADEVDAKAIDRSFGLDSGSPDRTPVPLPPPTEDLGAETIADYLAARLAGSENHAVGERLNLDQRDPTIDIYAEWSLDTLRRFHANALDGTITLVTANPAETEVGSRIWRERPAGSTLAVYRVDYAQTLDAALATETFVVIHDPASGFADWILVRIGGAPYPEVLVPPEPAEPSPSGGQPGDGSGDKPCLPAGQECG